MICWHFTSNFRTAFPVTSVNRLSKEAKVSKVIRLAYSGDPVLDPGQKSVIELASEWRISPLDSFS